MSHLSTEQIVMYRQGRLAGPDLLSVDDHLSECEECRMKLAGTVEAKLASVLEALESPGADRHLSFDQLRAYVDREAAPAERSAMDAHLRECAPCREEVGDLRRFSEQLKIQKKRGPSATRWFALGAIAAALITGIFLSRRQTVRESAPAFAISLHDGGVLIGLDRKGQLTAPAQLSFADRESLAAVLRDGTLPVSIDERLRSNRSVLLGGAGGDTPFRVLSPVGQMVLADRPEFQWQAFAGAKSYRVEVFGTDYTAVMTSPSVSGTSWTPERPLGRGKVYVWQVTALGRSEMKAPQPPEPEARFEIVDAAQAGSIDEARALSSHLLLASRYASAGLCSDALKELSILDAANPGSAMLSRMSADLSLRCSH